MADVKRKLAAILVADVVGYSTLMARDDAGTHAALQTHRHDVFDPAVAARNGRVIKLMGDGALVEFPSVVEAVEAALGIQRTLAVAGGPIQLRIGINLGDVIIAGNDIYGEGVNVAARLEALADPGGVCISGAAFDTVGGNVGSAFEDCGLQSLKNIEKPVRIYRLRPIEGTGGPGAAGRAAREKPSIAVMPFANMSGDADQEYFSDGITEDIITDLSRVSQLLVIAKNSTFSYKGRTMKAQQISSDLRAKFLVEGSVRRAGNRVRVTAQLVDGETGGHIWADRYDRDLTDVFDVQDDISRSIVDALKIAIAPGERHAMERIPTRNLKAYEFYLRGRQLLHEMNRENLQNARKMFAEAVAIDPEYAMALTGLADCDAALYKFYSSDRSYIDAAISNSRKALELDPSLAEAHASMGLALSCSGDQTSADEKFKSAIGLDPMLFDAYWYFGLAKLVRSDFKIAATLFTEASNVRGYDLQSRLMLMCALRGLNRDAEIQPVAEEALKIAERRLELNPDDSRAAFVGAHALIHLSDKPRALQWANIAARVESDDPRETYNLACAYSMLGQTELALDFLERSIKGGRPARLLDWARNDPDLAVVRRDLRFDMLMQTWREVAEGQSPGASL